MANSFVVQKHNINYIFDIITQNGSVWGHVYRSLHPDQYFTTTPLKMLKLKLNLIHHALINILNSSF